MKSSPANYLQFLVHTLVLVGLGHDFFFLAKQKPRKGVGV